DVIVIDAPCSGSGLFRRDERAINEWSEENVELCSQRQQRIISDAWSSLKKNGILIYSTCSYSTEEDEDIIDWTLENHSCESLLIDLDPSWGIIESISQRQKGYGYRFYPDKLKGEGFFLGCIRKLDGEEFRPQKMKQQILEKPTNSEKAQLEKY